MRHEPRLNPRDMLRGEISRMSICHRGIRRGIRKWRHSKSIVPPWAESRATRIDRIADSFQFIFSRRFFIENRVKPGSHKSIGSACSVRALCVYMREGLDEWKRKFHFSRNYLEVALLHLQRYDKRYKCKGIPRYDINVTWNDAVSEAAYHGKMCAHEYYNRQCNKF